MPSCLRTIFGRTPPHSVCAERRSPLRCCEVTGGEVSPESIVHFGSRHGERTPLRPDPRRRQSGNCAANHARSVLLPLWRFLICRRNLACAAHLSVCREDLPATHRSLLVKKSMMVVDPAGPTTGPTPMYLGRRRAAISSSISSEISTAPDTLHAVLSRPGVKPTAEEAIFLEQHIMFSHLEEDERVIVFRAMILQTFENGATIIKQGEQGSVFYVIDSGSCDIFVEKPPGSTTLVSTLSRGGSFGELALLYGSPRAASVIATSPVRCWSMDRATYHGLLACLATQKRTQYEAFLKNIPIFSPCTKWELLRIVDALQPVVYRPGDVIVRQGDPGDYFYIVLEGEVRVTKTLQNGTTVLVNQLGPSRYFGELALLNNQPRASTVTAATAVRCVRVNRDGFDRVLGPCEELLRRNSQVYAQVVGVPVPSTPIAKQ